MKYSGWIFCGVFLLSACNLKNGKEKEMEQIQLAEELEVLKAEMYKVHDEVMPKVGRMDQLKKCCTDFQKNTGDSALIQKLEMCKLGLGAARISMFDWMHRLHDLEKSEVSLEQKKPLYLQEAQSIEMVKDSMLYYIIRTQNVFEENQLDCK